MLKDISSLGKVLNKTEQKSIKAGGVGCIIINGVIRCDILDCSGGVCGNGPAGCPGWDNCIQ